MLAFYAGTGVICLLLVGFYFAWTPVRVWYWEREVLNAEPVASPDMTLKADSSGLLPVFGPGPRTIAARKLANCGAQAEPAFRRLLQTGDSRFRVEVVRAIYGSKHLWALPLLIEMTADEDPRVVREAIGGADSIVADRSFTSGGWMDNPGPQQAVVDSCRKKLLAWWKREGKAKYGRGE